jgi:NIMA (never in mitosis gene a)-related kinase
MEYCEKGDLYQQILAQKKKLEYFPEDTILRWITQACLGLRVIHSQRVLHRDLKTKNIFLTADDHIKIGDFGISRALSSTTLVAHSIVGAPYYMSPEMVTGTAYTAKTDIWSMGVVLYELAALQHPFLGNSIEDLAGRIIEGVNILIYVIYLMTSEILCSTFRIQS